MVCTEVAYIWGDVTTTLKLGDKRNNTYIKTLSPDGDGLEVLCEDGSEDCWHGVTVYSHWEDE